MALKSKIKVKEHENLSDANIQKVIDLLEAPKPITKKEAYEILNISANAARLAKIIDNYKAEKAENERRRAENRGKPAQPYEIQTVIENYLDGDTIAEISKRLYRSPAFVKEIIDKVGVPQRVVGASYFQPGIIPEQCAREEFEPGQIVWSARAHGLAIIVGEIQRNSYKDTSKYYRVFVIESIEEPSPYLPQIQGYGGRYEGAFSYDLGSLDHLKQYGVDVYRPYRPYFEKFGLKGN